jgi:outer membrane protein TolC
VSFSADKSVAAALRIRRSEPLELPQIRSFEREVESAREAFKIAQLQYRYGTADLLTVLQAQQTLFSAEDQLAQTMLAPMQAVVHLFEALGGGWVEHADEGTQFTSRQVGSQ